MNHTAQHTPGPWKVLAGTIITDDNDHIIAVVPETRIVERFWIIRSNAVLIAEAPAMLAALEALFEHCAMIHKHWGENCNQKESDAAIAAGQAVLDRIRRQE